MGRWRVVCVSASTGEESVVTVQAPDVDAAKMKACSMGYVAGSAREMDSEELTPLRGIESSPIIVAPVQTIALGILVGFLAVGALGLICYLLSACVRNMHA